MRNAHHLTPPQHGTFEFLAGMLTIAAPVTLGFGTAGLVAGFLVGGVLIGMALGLSSRRGRRLHSHRDFDAGFGIVTGAIAILLAVSGDVKATIFFAALAVIHAALSASTRYVSAG
jgi:hypothetical protein